MVSEELSEFEKQRLANIAERDALLKKLSLDAQSAGLFPLKPKGPSGDQSRPKKKKPAPKVKKEESPLPRRTSSRLRGIAADSEVAKRKADEEYDRRQAEERAKRVRKSDSFSLNDIFVSGQKLDGDALIGVDVITKGVAVPYQRTFGDEDIKSTTDKDLKAVRKEMSGLNLWEAWEPNRIKLTPERIYSMTFHPSEAKPLIFAGDKMGHLGILDASQEKPVSAVKNEDDDDDDDDDPDPVLITLKPHTRTISSMAIHPSKPTHLYTASYDSSIREMDLEKTSSVEKYAPESTSEDVPVSGIDMAAEDPNTIYWTTLDGAFGRYDLRTKRQSSVATWQLSEKKIGGFSLYQTHPHYFATASLDRTMRLWDLRKLSHTDPVSIGEHTSRLSVSHAAFNSAGQIATSSYDDTLKIYDFSARGISSWKPGHALDDSQMKPDTVVRHNCQTGRWVTILRPQWQLNPQSPIQRFCIGNMNRFVDIYSGSGDQLAQLGGEGITAVPAVAVFHRSKNWVAGGTASGKICLWM
ncbi:WD40-repeat-containing domain protein [Aspergillus keveii]|uniref:DNA damage-binding protein CMR1 n=1 Tax=Aspergillus keveii TaxID=714993 RepID=A0ABR4FPI9_9EURO